jgi:hypothetical protein
MPSPGPTAGPGSDRSGQPAPDRGRRGSKAVNVVMDVIGRFQLFLLYHQVEIRDAGDVDCPQWDTGEERVLAST